MKKAKLTYHRDILHQMVEVGDFIVFTPPGTRVISFGQVKKITPQGFTVDYNGSLKNRHKSECLKIDEQIQHAKLNNPEFYI